VHPDIFCWVSPPPADQPICQPFFSHQRNPTKWPKIEPFPKLNIVGIKGRYALSFLNRSFDHEALDGQHSTNIQYAIENIQSF
jgi:hypothetical protein